MARDYRPTTKPYKGKKQYKPTTKPYAGKKQYNPKGGKPFPEWTEDKTYKQWKKEIKAWEKVNPRGEDAKNKYLKLLKKREDMHNKETKKIFEDLPTGKTDPGPSKRDPQNMAPRIEKGVPTIGAARGGPVGYTQRWKTGRKS
jgi:hypothetical protein